MPVSTFPATQKDVTADGPPFHIDRQGNWYHGDEKINRTALVQVFADILRRDDDGAYWLWHPGERCRVTVEDAPFIIQSVFCADHNITCVPRYAKPVVLGRTHPLMMRQGVPYVDLGAGLLARFSTTAYYALVDEALPRDGEMVITSQGVEFSLGAIDAAG